MILLIDNYDSFVYNLARYFQRLGQRTHVVRNDAITPESIPQLSPDAIVLSPGPRRPEHAGCSLEIVRRWSARIPMLGVCLGHQTLAAAFGAAIVQAPEAVHGRATIIDHDGKGIFSRVPRPLQVARYHSLVVDRNTLPDELTVTAETEDGLVMAIHHKRLPVIGVQFHPESILTQHGYPLLANFLAMAKLETRPPKTLDDEIVATPPRKPFLPRGPLTF